MRENICQNTVDRSVSILSVEGVIVVCEPDRIPPRTRGGVRRSAKDRIRIAAVHCCSLYVKLECYVGVTTRIDSLHWEQRPIRAEPWGWSRGGGDSGVCVECCLALIQPRAYWRQLVLYVIASASTHHHGFECQVGGTSRLVVVQVGPACRILDVCCIEGTATELPPLAWTKSLIGKHRATWAYLFKRIMFQVTWPHLMRILAFNKV